MTETYFVKKVQYQPEGADGGTISWSTPDSDDKSGSQVEYWARDLPMRRTPEDPTPVHDHSVELTELKPCTEYSYRVISKRPDGKESIGEGTFYQPPVPAFDWEGFFPPVANLPATNVDNAGRTIPVKFSLGGNRGLDIFAAGYPKSEQTATAGSLSYDARDDQYTYTWRTDRAWSGQTRQLVLKFIDCSERKANFQFR
jgi:hypothetical protein